jgi:hypothetical protein
VRAQYDRCGRASNHSNASLDSTWSDADKRAAVFQELERILASRFFKNSLRGRQFREYVVHRKLEGNCDQLKERTIGAALFNRSPDYATGEDPVVRVQAGEVRRRLEQFYQEEPFHSPVRIELPLGSYAPHLICSSSATSSAGKAPDQIPPRPRARSTWRFIAILAILAGGIIGGWIAFSRTRTTVRQLSALEQFWSPVFATPQPVLICLAKPVVYRPSLELYRRYSRVHSGTFETEVERSNKALPLDNDEKPAS